MSDVLTQHLKDVLKFNHQRTIWLRISTFIAVKTLIIVACWNYIESSHLIWLGISIGLMISVVWWYWTMSLIRKMLDHKLIEVAILSEIVSDVKSIKDDVKKTNIIID